MAAPTLKIAVGVDLAAFEEGMKTLNALSRQAAKTTLEQFLAVNAELAKSSQTIMRTGDKQLSEVLSRSDMSLRAKGESAGKASKAKKDSEEKEKGKDDTEVKRPLLDFAKEADAVNKALENAAVNGIKKFEDGVIGLVMGTKTAKQAFSDMAKSIAQDFLRIAIRQVTGPLAGALGGLFGGGGGGVDPSFIGPMLPGNANGTDNWRGGLTWVGERGPELVNVPSGAQIIPNDILRSGGGGVSAPVRISIDARGADESGMARLQAQLAKLEANLPSRIVSTVREANKTRQLF